MARGVLAGAAMGGVFFLIPLILLLGCGAWMGVLLLRGDPNACLRTRLAAAVRTAREPLQVALVLILTGAVLGGFVAGDLGAGTYFRIGASTVVFVVESLTEWREATTSESISLRGLALVIIASCGIVSFNLWRYFSERWRPTNEAVAQADKRSKLGLSRRR